MDFIIEFLLELFLEVFISPLFNIKNEYNEIFEKNNNIFNAKKKILKKYKKTTTELLLKMYKINTLYNNLVPQKEAKKHVKKILKDNKHVIIYQINDKAVGCLLLNKEKRYENQDYKNNRILISNLYILPKYRNEKIIEELIDIAEKIANYELVDELVCNYSIKEVDEEKIYKTKEFIQNDEKRTLNKNIKKIREKNIHPKQKQSKKN